MKDLLEEVKWEMFSFKKEVNYLESLLWQVIAPRLGYEGSTSTWHLDRGDTSLWASNYGHSSIKWNIDIKCGPN